LQKNLFLTDEENCSLYWIGGVVILAHLRWGMLCVLLGFYDTLMWDRIFAPWWERLVARMVVVPTKRKVALGRGEGSQSLSTF
jgi:hypothetical protein